MLIEILLRIGVKSVTAVTMNNDQEKFIIQITDDEIVVIENISVETSDNGRAVRRVRYHLVETEIFSINNYFRVGY